MHACNVRSKLLKLAKKFIDFMVVQQFHGCSTIYSILFLSGKQSIHVSVKSSLYISMIVKYENIIYIVQRKDCLFLFAFKNYFF